MENVLTGPGGEGWAERMLRWPLVYRLLAAAVLTGAGAGVQVACVAVLGEVSEFVPFYFVAVLLSAIYLGLAPGLLAVGLGAVAAWFTLPPQGFLKFGHPADSVVVLLFAVLGVGVVGLAHSRRLATERARRAAVATAEYAGRLEAELAHRKRLEEELRRSNASLEDFSHLIAHDLKEPLRGVSMTAQFLAEDLGDRLGAEGREYADRLVRLPRRMIEMLDALLGYAQLSRGPIELEVADLTEVAGLAVEMLGPWLEEQRAEVVVPADHRSVHCDPAMVCRVLTNLITNGVKYNTSERKRVVISVRENGAEGPVVCVRDNGIGVPEEKRETLFKMFKRLHGRDEFGGGTGAGLALTKRMIERQGGRIWVEAGEGGVGSVFCFTLGGGQGGGTSALTERPRAA